MISSSTVAPVDLTTCDREPIHLPNSIQPSGVLLALNQDLKVVFASANLRQHFQIDAADSIGNPLAAAIGSEYGSRLERDLASVNLGATTVYLQTISAPLVDGPYYAYHALAHRSRDRFTILELEGADAQESVLFKDLYPLVTKFVSQLQGLRDPHDLTVLAAEEVRRVTDFDRVLVYRFDKDWHGTVVAESRNDRLPSYLDHRFPASDIPQQARELYRLNRLRIIADAEYTPVPLISKPNGNHSAHLDLTYSVLRSVSPIHLEYMRNMGTMSSMSISILRNGQLWGLISCHHHVPKRVPYDVRVACDFLGQVLSVQLEAAEYSSEYAERIRLKTIETALLAEMSAHDNFVDGLVAAGNDLLRFAEASGAAVIARDECRLIGRTPNTDQVKAICEWYANESDGEIMNTECLSEVFPPAKAFEDVASGVLAIRISKLYRSYLLWFRPEVIRTVKWGGEPHKVGGDPALRLHPRKSFETWKETLRGESLPWRRSQIEAAVDLRNTVVGIVLRKAEELAEISGELERANRELEAFSYSVSHDLRAPFRHIVGYAELLRETESDRLSERGRRYIKSVIESGQYAGTLVDNLLNFSRIGRTTLTMVPVDMNRLASEVVQELSEDAEAAEADDRRIAWSISDLPQVTGDPVMLRLVWRNLLNNAVKYSRNRQEAKIYVGCESREEEILFSVSDNGVGFDMRYVDKLFGVFQRLHRMEDFEGTGIGLANVRRIISRHKGRTWAEGEVGKGATFYFTLPASPEREVN